MKSMMVVSERRINAHVGEEYDVIVEVADEPTTDNIQTYADQVMVGIKDLWKQEEGQDDRKVVVYLDAACPFAAMLENLQIIMKSQDKIEIDLPWLEQPDVTKLDAESKEILRKLDEMAGKK